MKTCSKCGVEKLEAEFYFKVGGAGKLRSACKQCAAIGVTVSAILPLVKRCPKCGISKSPTEFSKSSTTKDRLYCYCKSCVKTLSLNRVRDREGDNKRRRERHACATESELKKKSDEYRNWRVKNLGYVAPCVIANPGYFAEYNKNRRRIDPEFKLLSVLRSRQNGEILRAGAQKSARTLRLTGCSLPELLAHFETLYRPGMTWENHGSVWHIDHIKPCAAFNLCDLEQQKACFHWTNLQPLFARDNLRKSDSYHG